MCNAGEAGAGRPRADGVPVRLTPAAARQLTEAYHCLDCLLACRHEDVATRQLLTLMQHMQQARRLM